MRMCFKKIMIFFFYILLFTSILFLHFNANSIRETSIHLKSENLSTQWKYNGTVICNITGYQTQYTTLIDSNENIFVSWADRRQDDGDIYLQKISGNGQMLWEINGISVYNDTNNSKYPRMVLDGEGGVILSWQDNRTGQNEIYIQRVNSQGKLLWTNMGKNITNISSLKEKPDLINTSDGNFVVVWQDNRTGTDDIYTQKFDINGNLLWGENGIAICNATDDQQIFAMGRTLIGTNDGGIVVTWQDARDDTGDIYVQRLDTNGISQWDLNGTILCNETDFQGMAIINKINDDNFTITWSDQRNGGGLLQNDLYIQKVNSSGTPQWSLNGTIISNATGLQEYVNVNTPNESNIITFWQNEQGVSGDVIIQNFNSTGHKKWGVNGTIVANKTGEERNPFCTISNGAICVAWVDKTKTPYTALLLQKIDSNGMKIWTVPAIALNNTHDLSIINMISDGDGGIIVTWFDQRNDVNGDLYMLRLNSSGGIWVPPPSTGGSEPPPDIRWILILVLAITLPIAVVGAAVIAVVIIHRRRAVPEMLLKKATTLKKLPEDHEKLLKTVGVFLAFMVKFKKG
ncbi:MAG: hypothetical protein EAX96_21055 [Candidatus Lokiarchaeota archaeon]|nr:hypothetical protein [Candidatus Lokiarchaeota archaeon]